MSSDLPPTPETTPDNLDSGIKGNENNGVEQEEGVEDVKEGADFGDNSSAGKKKEGKGKMANRLYN